MVQHYVFNTIKYKHILTVLTSLAFLTGCWLAMATTYELTESLVYITKDHIAMHTILF